MLGDSVHVGRILELLKFEEWREMKEKRLSSVL